MAALGGLTSLKLLVVYALLNDLRQPLIDLRPDRRGGKVMAEFGEDDVRVRLS